MNSIATIRLIGDVNGTLDLSQETIVPITFSVAEIRDLSKRKGTFSKSIELPGTKNNNVLLNHYFDANIEAGSFDINKLQYCVVEQNGVAIIENALLQLVSINKSQTNNNYEDNVTYTVLIKDVTSDFFSTINNKYLSDLSGFTEFNHLYTADNVIDSFTHTIDNGYKYVMPFNPEAAETASFDLQEFKPAIYARLIWDKIFQQNGYSYSWETINDNDIRFDKLLIPYVGDTLIPTKESLVNNRIEVTGTTTNTRTSIGQKCGIDYYTNEIVGGTNFPNVAPNITGIIYDAFSAYSITDKYYTVLGDSSNRVTLDLVVDFEYEINHEGLGATRTVQITNDSGCFDDGGNYFDIFPVLNIGTITSVNANPSFIFFENVYDSIPFEGARVNDGTVFNGGTTLLTTGATTLSTTVYDLDGASKLALGLKLNVNTELNSEDNGGMGRVLYNGGRYSLTITKINYRIQPKLTTNYVYGTLLDVNDFLPQKVKQSDYVKSICTMFNLYAELDKNTENKINFYKRDNYYDSGVAKDWTGKLAKDKEQELKFLPDLTNKKLILTYKEDNDFANKKYKSLTNEVYGQIEYTFDNEYVKEITKQELIFSPSPMINTNFGAITPMWNGASPKINIRILYDGGAYLTLSPYSIYNYNYGPNNFNIISGTTYPHIAHWDKPRNATYDLNFGVCDYYFRSDDFGVLTNNNLFNMHWRRTLNQINEGKLLTAYFYLTEYDIQRLRLNDKIRIDNSWWNINKISDYDANSNSLTKVELISIDDRLEIPYIENIPTLVDRASGLFEAARELAQDRNNSLNTNLSLNSNQVFGTYNYIGPNVGNSTVVGNNNFITDNAYIFGDNNSVSNTSFIFGSNNITPNEITNTIILGYGITADTSNTAYFQNLVVPSGGTINGEQVPSQISLTDTYLTGGTYSAGTLTLTDNTGGTVTVTGVTSSAVFTGSVQTTGALIKWDNLYIYNTYNSPTSLPLSADTTGAYIGVRQKIYHKSTVDLVVPLDWVYMGGNYQPYALNIIWVEYVSPTRIEYWIEPVREIPCGSIDMSFSVYNQGFDNSCFKVKSYIRDSVIVSGNFTKFNDVPLSTTLIRLNEKGMFDRSFNTTVNDIVWDIAVQTDNKIIIGGSFTDVNGTGINRIARLLQDGSLDSSFSIGTAANNSVLAIDVQSDGKIICGGSFTTFNGTTANIVRLNSDGSIDTSFTPPTQFASGIAQIINKIKIQSDGKILVGGNLSYAEELVRLNTNGSLDTTFQTNIGIGFNSEILTLDFQSDGKIICGGKFTDVNTYNYNRICRLNTDGSVDLTFASGGANGEFNDWVRDLKVEIDDSIYCGGDFTTWNANTTFYRFTKLTKDGEYDITFGGGDGNGFDDNVLTIDLDSKGRLLAGGTFTDYVINRIGMRKLVRLI